MLLSFELPLVVPLALSNLALACLGNTLLLGGGGSGVDVLLIWVIHCNLLAATCCYWRNFMVTALPCCSLTAWMASCIVQYKIAISGRGKYTVLAVRWRGGKMVWGGSWSFPWNYFTACFIVWEYFTLGGCGGPAMIRAAGNAGHPTVTLGGCVKILLDVCNCLCHAGTAGWSFHGISNTFDDKLWYNIRIFLFDRVWRSWKRIFCIIVVIVSRIFLFGRVCWSCTEYFLVLKWRFWFNTGISWLRSFKWDLFLLSDVPSCVRMS